MRPHDVHRHSCAKFEFGPPVEGSNFQLAFGAVSLSQNPIASQPAGVCRMRGQRWDFERPGLRADDADDGQVWRGLGATRRENKCFRLQTATSTAASRTKPEHFSRHTSGCVLDAWSGEIRQRQSQDWFDLTSSLRQWNNLLLSSRSQALAALLDHAREQPRWCTDRDREWRELYVFGPCQSPPELPCVVFSQFGSSAELSTLPQTVGTSSLCSVPSPILAVGAFHDVS